MTITPRQGRQRNFFSDLLNFASHICLLDEGNMYSHSPNDGPLLTSYPSCTKIRTAFQRGTRISIELTNQALRSGG